ncbi:hypothetical protein KRP22_006427 [Phytophthora ramorum]|nr:hypothetical protein KRP22_2442 [Phytophthora ramorum]
MLNIVFADEVDKEQKRRRHSVDMVAFRRNRKQKQSGLRSEYRRLEGQVKKISAKKDWASAGYADAMGINGEHVPGAAKSN